MADRYNLAGKETLNSIFRRTRIGQITAPQGELIAALFLNFYLGSGIRFSCSSTYSVAPIVPLTLEAPVSPAAQPKIVSL
jgi:hypothetical protein